MAPPTTTAALLQALRAGGGTSKPTAEANAPFLSLLEETFPELALYKAGEVATSPGVVEAPGESKEFFRTVGALVAVLSAYAGDVSLVRHQHPVGVKPEAYAAFCTEFNKLVTTEAAKWAFLVLLAVHDVGKSSEFRATVNATLPAERRTDDHDRALAFALQDEALTAKLLPSVAALPPAARESIRAGFATNFHLPQLAQGECACSNLRGLVEMRPELVADGSLALYLYHSIFDIGGGSCGQDQIYPLALAPVYVGFAGQLHRLVAGVSSGTGAEGYKGLYFSFLYDGFRSAYPEYDRDVFSRACAEEEGFKLGLGLAALRVLALTRNSYKHPAHVVGALRSPGLAALRAELAGQAEGPEVMLYYGPDLLRMTAQASGDDASGAQVAAALRGLQQLYGLGRRHARCGEGEAYELAVDPLVKHVKDAGAAWSGESLEEACGRVYVRGNPFGTEGRVAFSGPLRRRMRAVATAVTAVVILGLARK